MVRRGQVGVNAAERGHVQLRQPVAAANCGIWRIAGRQVLLMLLRDTQMLLSDTRRS